MRKIISYALTNGHANYICECMRMTQSFIRITVFAAFACNLRHSYRVYYYTLKNEIKKPPANRWQKYECGPGGICTRLIGCQSQFVNFIHHGPESHTQIKFKQKRTLLQGLLLVDTHLARNAYEQIGFDYNIAHNIRFVKFKKPG